MIPAETKTVAIVGSGTMGHGIAEVSAISGCTVYLNDIDMKFLDAARQKIEWSLQKMSEKGQLREDIEAIKKRIHYEIDLRKAVSQADLIIEAIPEKIELKLDLFRRLDEFARGDCVLATNTSSLPITEISSAVSDPSRVIGIHFFNPPVLMKLIEIIRSKYTRQEVVDFAINYSKKLGKKSVLVNKDVPGFIVNRILVRFMSTARLLVEKGFATIEEVDASLKFNAGLPMGAFELADYVGLDVVYFVERALAERGFKIPEGGMLESKFRSGMLGMKSGSGFYTYTKEKPRAEIRKELAGRVKASLVLAPAVNEAAWIISNDVANKEDIDTSTILGLGFQKGLLRMADEWGIDTIIDDLSNLKGRFGYEWLAPDPLLIKMKEEGRIGIKSRSGFYNY